MTLIDQLLGTGDDLQGTLKTVKAAQAIQTVALLVIVFLLWRKSK